MSEPKPFASLSPTLLARKGAARPAMRPQLVPLTAFEHETPAPFGSQLRHQIHPQDDLGWNDMGEETDQPEQATASIDDASCDQPAPTEGSAEPVVVSISGTDSGELPESQLPSPALRQLEDLADTLARAPAPRPSRQTRSALKEGRKAAFTLRLDGERHLRLRLACTLQNRSAQAVVTEALERMLHDLPGLDELARRVKRP